MPKWWSEPTAKNAFVLSWVSVVVTAIAAIVGIAIYMSTGSALILSWGVENCVDLLSSIVVLWRFYCPHQLTEETEKHLMKREKRASIAISIILGLLGIGIIAASIDDFIAGAEEVEKYRLILVISFFSIMIFGFLTIIKFQYALLLSSASLQKDGICSLIGTILAGALFVNTLIINHIPEAWWIDPSVALGCGIASIIIGVHAVLVAAFVQKIPIFSWEWWILSQGDGTDEVSGRHLGPEDLDVDHKFTNTEDPGTEMAERKPANGSGTADVEEGELTTSEIL
mmetsp:Transcript_6618/g.7316  ORF Transcript_6618/g.7316 Transcript_6618/m.7316 type:complete len:284 (-) Transcript_6618:213-1064(-)